MAPLLPRQRPDAMNTPPRDPLPEYDAERDLWASWWLAHQAIGEDVRAGRRELPDMFRPREERAG